jgi:hypothetical protein
MRVFITGTGIVSPLGNGTAATLESVKSGISGLKQSAPVVLGAELVKTDKLPCSRCLPSESLGGKGILVLGLGLGNYLTATEILPPGLG